MRYLTFCRKTAKPLDEQSYLLVSATVARVKNFISFSKLKPNDPAIARPGKRAYTAAVAAGAAMTGFRV